MLLIAVAAVLWGFSAWQTGGFSDPSITGESNVPMRDASRIYFAVSTVDAPTLGNYDSLDYPRGTTFAAPAGSQLLALSIRVTSDGTNIDTLTLGHAATRVSDSAAAPVDAVIIDVVNLPADSTIHTITTRATIPPNRIPFVMIDGAGSTWPGPVSVEFLATD